MISRRRLLAGAGALVATGCGASLQHFPFDPGQALSDSLGLELHFFSVCCALLRWRGGSVLFDPFWTHLPLRQVAFGRTLPDPSRLAGRESSFADTRAVMVGHGHYDHVLGLSLVDSMLASDAVILGSESLAHSYAAAGLLHPIVGLDSSLAGPNQPGRWWVHPSGLLRVLPIRSGHPNQWAFFHLYRRSLTRDRRRPPTRAHHLQEGPTLAFLVDLLDGDRIQARVYVETSSRGHPDGFFPPQVLADKPVDLALVSMDVANREMARGDSVLGLLRAPVVFFTHYEDFFSPLEAPPREIVKVDLPATRAFFMGRTEARYLFPAWDQRYRL